MVYMVWEKHFKLMACLSRDCYYICDRQVFAFHCLLYVRHKPLHKNRKVYVGAEASPSPTPTAAG
jgi:hypothetical protein